MSKVLAADKPRAGSLPVYVLAQISIHDRERYDRYEGAVLLVCGLVGAK